MYHILTRGNNGQNVFRQDDDYAQYLELLAHQLRRHDIKLFHYALLPNRVHLLVQPSTGAALSRAMLSINLRYAQIFQRRYEHAGHVWQGRFTSILVKRENLLLECGRYVELDPVRCTLTTDPASHRWSSYGRYALGASAPLLSTNPIYAVLGSTPMEQQKAYRQLMATALQDQKSGGSLDNRDFSQTVRDIERRFGFVRAPARRGRPPKRQLTSSPLKPGTFLFVGTIKTRRSRTKTHFPI